MSVSCRDLGRGSGVQTHLYYSSLADWYGVTKELETVRIELSLLWLIQKKKCSSIMFSIDCNLQLYPSTRLKVYVNRPSLTTTKNHLVILLVNAEQHLTVVLSSNCNRHQQDLYAIGNDVSSRKTIHAADLSIGKCKESFRSCKFLQCELLFAKSKTWRIQ
ncbi:hypothetical protein BD560DRAFT_426280 [Blakeslea trispora]|nr:hypothetical protein BD560DRAFT_426280 [Blakeslea trispora]